MTIKFEEKEIDSTESVLPKPVLYDSDKSYPYTKLNPFAFEDLTYFTIKQVIENESEWRGYDNILLLGGIKDSGRDCVLKSKGFLTGVIQCKHSEKAIALSKTKFAKEIIKFLLYALNDPELIPNPKVFTYFVFSSSGISSDTQTLIDDFNKQIFIEHSLEKWVNDVIKQHASLINFIDYSNVKEIIHSILMEIKVKQITLKDFDLQLSKDFNTNIITKFFSVKSVIDRKVFKDILDEKLDDSISYSDAINFIKSASKDLNEVDNFFGGNDSNHIERSETALIYDWILNDLPLKKKNLAVLEANAGLGKTVVFKDLSEKLNQNNIPVLAIKADRYYANNRVSLEAKLFQKANIEIEEIVSQLKQENQKMVILIDQLDALSQTLSTQREFLNTYNRLIDDLLRFREVRIVISVRTFDLNYDSDLGVYKSKEYNQFKLNPLRKEDVIKVLNSYGVKNQPEKFIELLRTPSHLNIFCKLSEKQYYNTDSLKTLNDLYNALWVELVTESNKRHLSSKKLLHRIAERMYANQQITITNIFKDEFSNELEFLGSKNIIAEDDKGIHFFHQSFYDYVFSRQFVEKGESLTNYLKQNGQSLYVRQTVKMVAEYLREFNSIDYLRTMRKIVLGREHRFHIKMLIITTLAYFHSPSDNEKQFVKKVIVPNLSYNEIFLGSVVSRGWINFLTDQNILSQCLQPRKRVRHYITSALRKSNVGNQIANHLKYRTYDDEREIQLNLVFRVLLNNLNDSLDLIIDFLNGIAESELGKNLIQRTLTHVDNWKNIGLLDLFDNYFPYIESSDKKYDNFWFYQIIQKISKYHPGFVFERLEPILIKVFETPNLSADLSYEQKSALEEIEKENPRLTFEFLFQLMNEIIEKNKIVDWLDDIVTPLYKSKYYCEMGIRGNVNHDADDIIFAILKKFIAQQAKTDKKYALNFYESNKDSDSIPVLMLCVICLTENPKYFSGQAFEIISKVYVKNGFEDYDNKLQLLIRVLLGRAFCYFSPSQIESITDMLFSIGHPHEYSIFKDEDKKSHILNFRGKKQYLFLKAIPLNEIKKHDRLNRRFQELKRKFPDVKEKRLDESKMISYAVGPPLKRSAYENMGYKHWKNSMIKYGDDYRGNRHAHPSKGGKHQHAQAFKSQVAKKPKELYGLIFEIIDNKDISIDYPVYGIWGLIEGKHSPKKVVSLYHKLIRLELDEGNTLQSIWFVNYLLEHELIDRQIFDYLSNLALNYRNSPRKISPPNLERESLNTVRSAAIIKIMLSSYDSQFGDLIFDTVEEAAKDSNDVLKVGILGKIAYLNQLDIERAFGIFEKLTVTDNIEVFKASFWSADYYKIRFFDRMQVYFNKILSEEEFHENGIRLITKCWLHPKAPEGSYDLLKGAFKKGELALCSILNIAEHNLFTENTLNEKSYKLLFECLKKKGDSISSQLSGLILRKFKADNFESIHSFLKEYVKSDHAQKEPRYFFSYLIICSKQYPIECLELMQKTTHFDNTDVQRRGSFDKEPVQVILSIYSSLNKDFDKNIVYIKRALNIFDKMLQNNNMRLNANKAINEL